VKVDGDQVTRSAGRIVMNQPKGASAGTYFKNSIPDDSLSLTFQGKQIDVVHLQGPSFGVLDVELDGVSC
jgi:hypothetical protein